MTEIKEKKVLEVINFLMANCLKFRVGHEAITITTKVVSISDLKAIVDRYPIMYGWGELKIPLHELRHG